MVSVKLGRSASGHHGDISQIRNIAGFRFFETRYRAHSSLAMHSHEHACICLVVSGHLQEDLRTSKLHLNARSLAFRPAGEVHGNRFGSGGAHCLVVEVPDAWTVHVREYGSRFDQPVCAQGGQIEWLGVRLYRQYKIADAVAPLAIQGIMLEIAGGFCGHASHRERSLPRWLQQARDAAHANYDRALRVQDLAEDAGVHPVHLAREFRRRYGCSVGEYVRKLRIEAACERLIRSDSSVAEIALETGFSSQSHFSRVFRLITGMSPSHYRVCRQS